MSAITTEQLAVEIENIKREMDELRGQVNHIRVTPTVHPHIITVAGVHGGEPIVREAYVSVRTIVEQTRLGTTLEQLVAGYPPLTLAGIHDALSYYYDNREEIDSIITEHHRALERALEFVATVRK